MKNINYWPIHVGQIWEVDEGESLRYIYQKIPCVLESGGRFLIMKQDPEHSLYQISIWGRIAYLWGVDIVYCAHSLA